MWIAVEIVDDKVTRAMGRYASARDAIESLQRFLRLSELGYIKRRHARSIYVLSPTGRNYHSATWWVYLATLDSPLLPKALQHPVQTQLFPSPAGLPYDF